MPVTAGWIDKQAEAKSLLATVKQLNADGIDTGEKAAEAHSKMAEVQRLMGEVKAEKLVEEKSKLVDLLEQYEKADPSDASRPISGPIVSTKGGVGDRPSAERLVISPAAAHSLEMKSLGEAAGSTGGFLVPPAYLQDLFAETRRQGNALRRFGWMSEHPVTSNQVLFPRGTGNATVGIVAEHATKPSADQTFGQVTVNIFTWAGISKLSNQLLQDSSPTAADMSARELGSLLGNLEEQKILNGSGSGEPRGILNTVGVPSFPIVGVGAATPFETIDRVLDAITSVTSNYFAAPSGILMAPRRLAQLQRGRTADDAYLFNPSGQFHAPGGLGANDPGATSVSTGAVMTMPSLFGLPIGVSTNMPTDLGFIDGATPTPGTEDAIIVGAWSEAHWFQRSDVTLDVSDQAGDAWETNATWFRLEERAGFSAERYPQAFAVVTGLRV